MNVAFLLTPKAELAFLDNKQTIRQALEKMKAHHYSAIPLIDRDDGKYLGSLSEGDFLWYILATGKDKEELEKEKAISLIRKDYMQAVGIDANIDDVFAMVLNQNYVPVVDDREVLVGIITRRSIINYYAAQLIGRN